MKRLAIVSSHPIQYNAPWFRLLAGSTTVLPRVFYTWEQSARGAKYDPDFGRKIEWDIPLLEGYDHVFVQNTSPDPGTHHFKGLINPTLNRQIQDWDPDALLVFGWSFASHLKCLRHFHGKIPVLFRGDSTLLDEQTGIRRLARRLFLKWIYRHVDHALYVGTHNREYFLKHGLGLDQLVSAPHAVDNQRFAGPEEQYARAAADWRRSLGIESGDLVLLFAGKLEPKKNPFFLLEIAKRITSPQLKIIFTGNGVLEDPLKEAAAGDRRILFLDFQNQQQMPMVYRMGDIFILPSRGPGETWGLSVNEAMASGRTIMMSKKAGGAVDLVAEGENGLLFKPDEVEKCSAWISLLLQDRRQLTTFGQASRERIREFSFEHIVQAVEKVLAE
jgi:glycosyltransferase involved in cell wall biosynthesis